MFPYLPIQAPVNLLTLYSYAYGIRLKEQTPRGWHCEVHRISHQLGSDNADRMWGHNGRCRVISNICWMYKYIHDGERCCGLGGSQDCNRSPGVRLAYIIQSASRWAVGGLLRCRSAMPTDGARSRRWLDGASGAVCNWHSHDGRSRSRSSYHWVTCHSTVGHAHRCVYTYWSDWLGAGHVTMVEILQSFELTVATLDICENKVT